MVPNVRYLGYGQATGERRTVGGGGAAAPADAPTGHAGPPASAEPGGADRDHLRAQDGLTLGVLPAGVGLLWHDAVAPAAGVAGRGRMGAAPPRAAAAPGRRGDDRLESG